MKDATRFGDYFQLPNPKLRAYFGIVENGQDVEIRTPFAKGRTVSEVVNEWFSKLDKLEIEYPQLHAYEAEQKGKVGPLSIMKPLRERMDDINHYYEDILLPQHPVSDEFVEAVLSEFQQIKGLRLRSIEKTLNKMKLSTNSGSPYFTKRRDAINGTIPFDITIFSDQDYIQHLSHGDYLATAVLGWRGQEGGPSDEDVKQRVVWMFPFAVNIAELTAYQPLIEACQKFNLVPAWVSMDEVDRRITQLFDSKGSNDLVICTDFSKFDQHFNPVMQDTARRILSGLFTEDSRSSEWLANIFPIKYNIPLAYDMYKIRKGQHGMGSGSGGTNADETLAHRSLQHEAAMNKGSKLNPNSMCLGDDGVLTFPGIEVDDLVEVYTSHGLEMNVSKQYVSKDDCIYLRRWHHKDYRIDGICVGVYPTCRALGRLCEQERFYTGWSSEMVALRQLSILENVKFHPMREEFVDFCMRRDKYRLGLDIPGFMDNLDIKAKEATDRMPDFLGYVRSEMSNDQGIQDWWIVKYLLSLK